MRTFAFCCVEQTYLMRFDDLLNDAFFSAINQLSLGIDRCR